MTPRAVLAWCGSCENSSARIRYFFSDTESWLVGGPLDSLAELHTRPRILRKQDVAVKIDVGAEACDLRGRSDTETRLDHAAEHDAQVECARRVCHAYGFADTAGLCEFDVDAVRAFGARRDVAQPMAVFVDVNWDRRRGFQPGTVRVTGGQRLLAVLHVELREPRQRVERLVECPGLVHIHLERRARDLANSAHALQVQAVARAELELQSGEVHRPGRTPRHVVRIAEPDRPGRRRSLAFQPEQSPHREIDELSLQIVQRSVDRGARCPFTRRQSLRDCLERKRIVAEHVAVLLDVRERGLRALAVALDWSRLAEPRDLAVPYLHEYNIGRVARLARDDERLGELERRDPGGYLHRGYTSHPRACSSGDRACASGAQGRRFDSCQAHSPSEVRLGWRRAMMTSLGFTR